MDLSGLDGSGAALDAILGLSLHNVLTRPAPETAMKPGPLALVLLLAGAAPVWGAMWHKGHIYAADSNSGLWIMKLQRAGEKEIARH
ncbi:MAG TPA: hypothetical protein VMR66_11945 [Gemmatimonadota bacterium]|nr:hypothetical protein [Gemmatimonadota bacterium]